MKELFFWKSWTRPEQRTVWLMLGVLSAALVYLVFRSGILSGHDGIDWDIMSVLADTVIPANRFNSGDLSFSIPVPSVYLTEQYVSPLILPDKASGIIFLILSALGLSVLLASLTTLSRFWYLGGMAVFILLLVFSRLEMITFPGLPERTMLALCLLLYIGTGYYFHAFRPHTGIVTRIAGFAAVSALLLTAIFLFSGSTLPVYTFLVYSLPLWLVPALLFFVVSATEILYGLVWLTTSATTGMGRRSLPNLAVITFIYLLILVFAYVANTRIAGWGIVLVPAYVLGGLAAVTGLAGFRPRCESTEGQLPFRQSGFWLYTGLFLIAAGVTGMAVAAGNDPLLEVLEDTVVNSQLGMGASFVFYIAANFLPLLRQGLQVHKVLYKPVNFSLTKTRIIGFAIVAGLFSMQNLFPVKQGLAAYFNGLGDLHTLTGEYVLAEQYYKISLQQEFQNHKGNYALATLARIQGDDNAAVYYFRQATLKKPSPQAYIGLGNLLAADDLYFEAMFSLREGNRAFPGNAPILNNLGLLYARTNLSDSAYYFLSQAEKVSRDQIPSSNILGVLSGVLDTATLDSLAAAGKPGGNLSWEANKLLVRNLAGRNSKEPLREDAVRADSLLNAAGYAYWLNYTYNQVANDSTLADKVRRISRKNDLSADDLLLAAAHADFYGGHKTRALETVLQLAGNEGKKSALYHKILGHWFLQTGLYDKAIDQFSPIDDPDAIVGLAIAQALSGNPVTGMIMLEKLRETGADSADIVRLQQSVTSLKPPVSKADSLLSHAAGTGTEEAYREALRYNPYDPDIVAGAADFFSEKKNNPASAYQVVVDALRFNEKSPVLWGRFALLNLDLGLSEQAEEAREKVRELAGDTVYHDFLTRYQLKWSLKQKEKEEFK